MIYGIKPGSETYSEEGKGGVYTVIYRCDRNELIPVKNPAIPSVGDQMPDNPFFRLVDLQSKEGTGGDWEVTLTYSTERQLAESFCDESIEIGVEPVDDNDGWFWEDTGTPVIDPLPRVRPVITMSLRLRDALPPLDKVWSNLNTVNSKTFRGITPGYLRFDGATADNQYALDGSFISAASVYKFTARTNLWNLEWRKALQARDRDGNPIYWQNIDAEIDFYTTDMAKIGTPVWIHETPGQSLNLAGIAAWDTQVKDGLPYYQACDFATVLSLPRKEGDD